MNLTALESNVGIEFSGRMGNNMIQYLFARAEAVRRRHGIVKIPYANDIKFGRNLNVFSRVTWHTAHGHTVKLRSLCGGEFAQYYLVLKRHRALAKCLFSPRFLDWRPKYGLVLNPTDVVIHFRDPSADGEHPGKISPLPADYFAAVLLKIKFNKVFIITVPKLRSHPVVKSLIHRFSAEIYSDSPAGDWSLAVMAPIFIGSFGTFSWMAAFLSEGQSIHLPYVSGLKSGASWVPWSDLFIDDDARIVYHDLVNPNVPTHETASSVISRNTVFARSLRERRDPCVTKTSVDSHSVVDDH